MALAGVFQASKVADEAVLNGDDTGISIGDYRIEMGPVTDGGSGDVYMLRMYNGYDDDHGSYIAPFWIDGDGNAEFAGSLSAATGTFAGSLSAATGSFSGTITASSFTTGAGGKRVEITKSDNEIHFYGDRGDGGIEELGSIGTTLVASYDVIALMGTDNFGGTAGYFRNNSAGQTVVVTNKGPGVPLDVSNTVPTAGGTMYAVKGVVSSSNLGVGVYGDAITYGVHGKSTDGYGLYGQATASGGYGVYGDGGSAGVGV
ncbi:MAG: hypothetical protein JRC86_13870, partial [Deltaproteobacteria bacterium]|nr:hypothetical protein [Deltaproteobacteria bacterium]